MPTFVTQSKDYFMKTLHLFEFPSRDHFIFDIVFEEIKGEGVVLFVDA